MHDGDAFSHAGKCKLLQELTCKNSCRTYTGLRAHPAQPIAPESLAVFPQGCPALFAGKTGTWELKHITGMSRCAFIHTFLTINGWHKTNSYLAWRLKSAAKKGLRQSVSDLHSYRHWYRGPPLTEVHWPGYLLEKSARVSRVELDAEVQRERIGAWNGLQWSVSLSLKSHELRCSLARAWVEVPATSS